MIRISQVTGLLAKIASFTASIASIITLLAGKADLDPETGGVRTDQGGLPSGGSEGQVLVWQPGAAPFNGGWEDMPAASVPDPIELSYTPAAFTLEAGKYAIVAQDVLLESETVIEAGAELVVV